MIVGHDRVRRELETHLPPVTLLLGPASIGKRTLAEHLAQHHAVLAADTFTRHEALRIDDVRDMVRFVGTRPFGPFKLVLARLDGATTAALNAALKVLEEPPDTARFLLTSATHSLPTVMSRCQVYLMGVLNPDAIREILLRHKIPAHIAARVAAQNPGQVDVALKRARGTDDKGRETALALARAIAGRDRDAFDIVFTAWDESTERMFLRWLHEASTGLYVTFTEAEMFGFERHRHAARMLAEAIGRTSRARSRLGMRAALEPFVARS